MNNNLYHWHAEQMVKYEMEEVKRAAEQARLLKEAGLSGPSLPSRLLKTLQNLLKTRRERVENHRSPEHESYSYMRETE